MTDHARMITDAQRRKMFALFREHGVTNRWDRMERVSAYLVRQVESSNQLSQDEAKLLIDWLETRAEAVKP